MLTRGYPSIGSKWRYGQLILRNIFLKLALKKQGVVAHNFIFHEGNISFFDQGLIKLLSFSKLDFVSVATQMKLPDTHVHTGANSSLGYALMCRFQYFGVWQLIQKFDLTVRVDEDCLVLDLPNLKLDYGFLTGALTEESHAVTNASLPYKLRELGLESFYDHRFPYTNVFITRPSLWLRPDIQKALSFIAEDSSSLENRWGDIPVLGVVINAYPKLFGEVIQSDGFHYIHLSHLTKVRNGEFNAPDFTISIKRPIRSLRLAIRFLTSKNKD